MKKWKAQTAAIFLIAILVTLIPSGIVQAKSKAPQKLGAKDFVFSYGKDGKKKFNFIQQLKIMDAGYIMTWEAADIKSTSDGELITERRIIIGDKVSRVKKKYGNTARIKVTKKDTFYKYIKYTAPVIQISIWKNFLEYSYKKGSDTYNIRFYLDKKNKVASIAYIKNLKEFFNYPDKELKPGLTFQAPDGQKITTKTLNGKKVYIIPRGTKINFKKGAISKAIFNRMTMSMSLCNIYGEDVGDYNGDRFMQNGTPVKQGKDYDLESIINEGMYSREGAPINTETLGNYLFFTITCDDVEWKGIDEKRKKSPAVYYFKFKD